MLSDRCLSVTLVYCSQMVGWIKMKLGMDVSMGFAFWLRYCSDVAQRKSPKLCTLFGRLLTWYTIYTLSGSLAS